MPYNRIKSFLLDVMHIDISEGSIRNFIEDAGDKAGKICDRIASELVKSPVAGADESGLSQRQVQLGLDIAESETYTDMDSQRPWRQRDGRPFGP